MIPEPDAIRSILATDCGSTTTKAILIEKGADGFRLATRGEAPTTVEAPFEDVTRGVLNAGGWESVALPDDVVARPWGALAPTAGSLTVCPLS